MLQEVICHLQRVLEDYINKVIGLRQRRNRRQFKKKQIDLPAKPVVVKGNLLMLHNPFLSFCVNVIDINLLHSITLKQLALFLFFFSFYLIQGMQHALLTSLKRSVYRTTY